jgi:hypothetical protein
VVDERVLCLDLVGHWADVCHGDLIGGVGVHGSTADELSERRAWQEGLRVFVVNRPRFGGKVFQLHKGQLRGSARHVPAEMTQDEQDT